MTTDDLIPDGIIDITRRGLWKPWRWTYTDFRDNATPAWSIEGRTWTRRRAQQQTRIVRVLRRHGAMLRSQS